MRHERRLQKILIHRPIRLVLPHPPFLGHHLPLGLIDVFRHLEAAHPIRFQIQRHLQMIGRNRIHIHRLIEARERIGNPPDHPDQLHVFFRLHMCRSAEHHVLKHVRKPLPIRPFVTAAHMIQHPHMHHRRLMQRHINHLQPVIQRLGRKRNVLRRANRKRHSRQNRQCSQSKNHHASTPESFHNRSLIRMRRRAMKLHEIPIPSPRYSGGRVRVRGLFPVAKNP